MEWDFYNSDVGVMFDCILVEPATSFKSKVVNILIVIFVHCYYLLISLLFNLDAYAFFELLEKNSDK